MRGSGVTCYRRRWSNGSVAEWSKALDLGSSLSGGVGSNPTAISFSNMGYFYRHLCSRLSQVALNLDPGEPWTGTIRNHPSYCGQ